MTHDQTKAVNPTQITEIVNKHNAQSMLNTEIDTSQTLTARGLSIDILPIDISELRQIRHIRVEPNSSIPEHAHEGPVFRFITKGSAVVNGITYEEGDWMIIPAKTKYNIETSTGYEALWVCGICSIL